MYKRTPFNSDASTASLVVRAPVELARSSNQAMSCVPKKLFKNIDNYIQRKSVRDFSYQYSNVDCIKVELFMEP